MAVPPRLMADAINRRKVTPMPVATGPAFNKFAAGSKVYGGGRPFPNKGAVDKSGYVDRTANNKAKQRQAAIARRLSRNSGRR